MLKITCLLLCVVAATLSQVYASTEEEKAAYNEAMASIIDECGEQKESEAADGTKSCLYGCVLKKSGLIDSKGFYDIEKGVEELKNFMKREEDFVKGEKVLRECAKEINEKPVSDGDAGCERAELLMACTLEHKDEIPIILDD